MSNALVEYENFSARGRVRGAAPPNVNLGTPSYPIISPKLLSWKVEILHTLRQGQILIWGMQIFRKGGVPCTAPHSVNPEPPHISETVRARTLRLYAHLHGSSTLFGCKFLFRQGACKGQGPPTVFLGPPHISEISRDRKLKCHKHLGRVKYLFRVWHFLRQGPEIKFQRY